MRLTWGSEFAFSSLTLSLFFSFWLKTVADRSLPRVPVTDTVFICPLVAEPLVHCQSSGTFFGCCGQEQHSEDTANQKAYRVMNWVSPWLLSRNSELHCVFLFFFYIFFIVNVPSVPLADKSGGWFNSVNDLFSARPSSPSGEATVSSQGRTWRNGRRLPQTSCCSSEADSSSSLLSDFQDVPSLMLTLYWFLSVHDIECRRHQKKCGSDWKRWKMRKCTNVNRGFFFILSKGTGRMTAEQTKKQ